MGFRKPVIVEEPIGSDTKWTLHESFTYDFLKSGINCVITVPMGFKTDFASIPRIFWTILHPTGKGRGAAVIHDYLYSVRGLYDPSTAPLTRKESDRLFLAALKELDVSWVKRFTMWRAVRRFGWISYPKAR